MKRFRYNQEIEHELKNDVFRSGGQFQSYGLKNKWPRMSGGTKFEEEKTSLIADLFGLPREEKELLRPALGRATPWSQLWRGCTWSSAGLQTRSSRCWGREVGPAPEKLQEIVLSFMNCAWEVARNRTVLHNLRVISREKSYCPS